jgi:hypothetical protein
VLVDERGEVAKSYGSRGTPGAILIDPNGVVASAHASGDREINDLLIEAFGLAEVVAAVVAEIEAKAEASTEHDDDDGHDHTEHLKVASPAEDLLDPQTLGVAFVPVGRSDVSIAERDDEMVLVDHGSGAVHVLNPTAAIVWQCLDGTGSVEEIVGDIAEVFERDKGEVQEAVLEVVRRFGRQGLLEGVGFPPEKPAPAQPAP